MHSYSNLSTRFAPNSHASFENTMGEFAVCKCFSEVRFSEECAIICGIFWQLSALFVGCNRGTYCPGMTFCMPIVYGSCSVASATLLQRSVAGCFRLACLLGQR
jgi:hypothetical protein